MTITGVYLFDGKEAEAKYILSRIEKGSVIVSVTGSGQVSASSQVDLKPKVSGDVAYVGVKVGDKVKTGSLIARIDDKEAQKSVRDAEIGLESAEVNYNKLIEAADLIDITEAENTLSKAEDDLKQARNNSRNSLSDAFTEMPDTVSGLHDLMFGTDIGSFGVQNIRSYKNLVLLNTTQAENNMTAAKYAYDNAESAYRSALDNFNAFSIDLSADDAKLASLMDKTYDADASIIDAVRKMSDLIKLAKDDMDKRDIDAPEFMTEDITTLSSYASSLNSEMSGLMSLKNTLRNSIASVPAKQKALSDLRNGPEDIDLRSAKLSVDQKNNTLKDAKEKLSNYYIRAPFDGTIAKMNIKNADSVSSDSVSSGSSIATLVTEQKLAEISLNEVDVSKVKIGNKAIITLDAISDLSISGKVVEMDTIGTVSQGVVTYSVKISFDAQDERIKSGMSLSVSIMTDVKQDVLTAPSSSIKYQNGSYYIELAEGIDENAVLDPKGMAVSASSKTPIEVGLANDEVTEIISGITEGDIAIVRSLVSSSAAKTTGQSPSLLGSGGSRSGNVMMMR